MKEGLERKLRFQSLKTWNLKEGLARKLRFQSMNTWNLKEDLARKLRFQSLNTGKLKDVTHEMRFCEIADAKKNAVFCKAKCVSDDVWGSLSGGRVRNTLA